MDKFIEALTKVLEATAVPMETPPAYGALHLSFTLIGFALSFFLAWKLRKLGDKGNRAVIFGMGVFLTLTEIYKQLLYALVLHPDGYDWGIFPFHFCSIGMYSCLVVTFLPAGKIRRAMYCFMMTFNLMSGFIAFFEPSGLLHHHWPTTFHSLIWHMALVFIGLYVAFSRRGGTDKKDFKYASVMFLVLAAVAFGINCAFREVSGGALNNFFVGPSNSSLIVFKQISEAFGWYTSTLLYIPAVIAGAGIFFLVFRWALDGKPPFKKKKNAVPEEAKDTVREELNV